MNEIPNEATLQATAAHLTEKMDAIESDKLIDTVRAAKAQAWVEGLSAGVDFDGGEGPANPYLDKAEQEAQA